MFVNDIYQIFLTFLKNNKIMGFGRRFDPSLLEERRDNE
jgi:hypothetical protein